MLVRNLLWAGLAVMTVVILVAYSRSKQPFAWPKPLETAIGFVTNFFDTLGIGSFAPTTSLFKFFKLVPDEKIPGTLNVGHTLPTIVEAFVFIAIVGVDPVTLITLIFAAIAGAWLGAGIVSHWPRRYVQIGMGSALLVAAAVFVMQGFDKIPGGGVATGLSGSLLIAGIVVNFCLGALMTIGIGLYAPAMIMVSLLGMTPKAAFPIMMGSCAFLMPIASLRFAKFDAFSMRASIGLALGGIPAVLLAALVVKSLPIYWVRWLVVVVVVYASWAMLRSAIVERGKSKQDYEVGVKSVQVDSLADENLPGSEPQVMLPKQPGHESLNP
ncbi:MAG: TSUP family transporter [Candidatus Eremiobacteraeota bacterium]|nr:TSUP family transporter [Candidatus Eremiobacteraeota bacterium]MBV8331471.1 TSUP family transporter [Candidatus Eremiobacteraeota bacterium]